MTVTLEKEENSKIMAIHMMDYYAATDNPVFREFFMTRGMFMVQCGGEKVESKAAHVLFHMYTHRAYTHIEALKKKMRRNDTGV